MITSSKNGNVGTSNTTQTVRGQLVIMPCHMHEQVVSERS